MTPELSRLLQVVALIAAFVSAMVLYYGTLGAHRELQAHKEQLNTNSRRRRRQRAMRWIGIPAATIALVCQLIVILYPSSAY
jgi:membrane protein DedA with SNARE-associated domain